MNISKGFIGLILIVGVGLLVVREFTKRGRNSPLGKHFTELEAKARIGALSEAAAYASAPPSAMLGEGWATTTQANKANTNPWYNTPGKVRFGVRLVQPVR